MIISARLNSIRGLKATDKISGFKGTITAVGNWISGNERVCITPEVDKDGKYTNERWFDYYQIEVKLEDKISDVPAIPAPEIDIVLGQEVIDRITEVKGIVTATALYLNGCLHLGTLAKKDKEGKVPKLIWTEVSYLKVIGKGVSEESVVKEEVRRQGPADDLYSRTREM